MIRAAKKFLFFLFFCLLFLCFTGMSGNPDAETIKLPKTSVNFVVSMVDQSDVETDLSHFSCEGQTYFLGKRGRADLSVSFERIREARFFWEAPLVRADFTLNDGEVLDLLLKPKQACYGVSQWGNVMIDVRDLKSLKIRKGPQGR